MAAIAAECDATESLGYGPYGSRKHGGMWCGQGTGVGRGQV